MLKFLKAFFDLEWIPAVGKWILKFASYSIEIPMVISAIYIMLVSGIPGWKDALWYDRSIGLLLASPEILLPGAIIRATSMFQRGEVKKAKVTIWIISAMAGLTALTLALIMIFHLDETSPLMACVLFLRILASLAYSIITRIEMDGEHVSHPDLPALLDSWQLIGLAAYLQQDFQQQLNQAIAKLPVPPALSDIQQMIDTSLGKIQDIENSVSGLDYQQLAASVLPVLKQQFEVFLVEQKHLKEQFADVSKTSQIEAPKTAEQRTKTHRLEVSKRSKKIDENEVDAVVHPLKSQDKGLSVRKIAERVPYSETVVFASLKRWQKQQSSVFVEETEDTSGAS